MKKKQMLILAMAATMVLTLTGGKPDEVMTRQGDTYVVNTATLARDVEGYVENTPLLIYIKNDRIERVEAQPNKESPKYFQQVKRELLKRWDGKKAKTVLRDMKAEADGVTGATYSSNAVIENLKRGLQYYLKHKK